MIAVVSVNVEKEGGEEVKRYFDMVSFFFSQELLRNLKLA